MRQNLFWFLRRQAFSLIELLIVVIIMSILASVAIPQYLRTSERSRSSEALNVLATIRASEIRFKTFNPALQYTNNISDLDVEIPGYDGIPPVLWNYSVTGTGAGADARAERRAGSYKGETIVLDLDTGATCGSDPVYGLPAGGC